MNSFKKYFWDVIRNHYVDFDGVATRKQFWLFVLWSVLFPFIIIMGFLLIQLWQEEHSFIYSILGLILSGLMLLCSLIYLLSFIPSITISVRRLHDAGFSGWFLLLNFVPYVGSLVVFIMFLLPSKIHDNKYRNGGKNIISENNIDKLEKLHSLREKGVITEKKFEKQKKDILD